MRPPLQTLTRSQPMQCSRIGTRRVLACEDAARRHVRVVPSSALIPGEPALDRRLERACALGSLLVDGWQPARGDRSRARDPRRIAQRMFDHADLAIAAFEAGADAPRVVNAAWRTLFAADARGRRAGDVPDAIAARIPAVERTRRAAHVAEVVVSGASRIGFCAARVAPRGERGVIVACADITAHVGARLLSATIDDALWTGDASGKLERANAAWYRGSPAGAGASWLVAVHRSDRARCRRAMSEAVRTATVVVVEARLRRDEGMFAAHQLRFTGIAGESRGLAAAVPCPQAPAAVGRDDVRASAVDDPLLAAVSHELRAPVAALLLWESVLRDPRTDDELRSRALDAIHHSAITQSRLVGDLIDVARATAGKLRVERRSLQLAPLLEQAVQAIAPAIAAKHLRLELAIDPAAGFVEGDAVRLRQVFDNLLANALAFTSPGGRMTITAARHDASIAIQVGDTGRGVPAEFLPHLFEPFRQADLAPERSERGLGLGLTIARELVVLHGGHITAESPGIGGGTTVTVTLPAVAPPRVAASAPPRAPCRLDGLRVLVVDDDPRVLSALDVLLRRAGADVRSTESADAARAVLAEQPLDVLICDVAMPRETGYDLVRQLRSVGIGTPAIALTAHATPADARAARDAGFDLHLAKPVAFDQLAAEIRRVVEARTTTW